MTAESVVAFVGPSVHPELWTLPVELRPPAVLGDMAPEQFRPGATVVFIDAAFLQSPAPTHLEILRLIERGHRVIGAASAGALRAVELRAYGVELAGSVAEAFRTNVIVDDGEVAVMMDPRDYRAATVPLVNVRRALQIVLDQQGNGALGVLNSAMQIAQDIYWMERTSHALHDGWTSLPSEIQECLARALASEDCNVKARDALTAVKIALGKPGDSPTSLFAGSARSQCALPW